MEIIIKSVDNGFIITELIKIPGEDKPLELVFEDHTGTEESDAYIVRMLYAVAEFFGTHYDKFSPNNLNITWDKVGHKYADPKDYLTNNTDEAK